MNMEKNALVKYTFLKLLLREFGIYIRETEVEKADLAKQCVWRFMIHRKNSMKRQTGIKTIQSRAVSSIWRRIKSAGESRGKSGIFPVSGGKKV